VGDCCSGIKMSAVDVAYISYDTTGAYTPAPAIAGPPAVEPTVAIGGNTEGGVTVTFEGILQVAPSVNGPWENIDAPSPVVLKPEDMTGKEFFRAKSN